MSRATSFVRSLEDFYDHRKYINVAEAQIGYDDRYPRKAFEAVVDFVKNANDACLKRYSQNNGVVVFHGEYVDGRYTGPWTVKEVGYLGQNFFAFDCEQGDNRIVFLLLREKISFFY